jgi:hypothetical protein
MLAIDMMKTTTLSNDIVNAREQYLAKLKEDNNKMYELVEGIRGAHHKVLLMFLFDATASMGSYMRLCRDSVKKISSLLNKNFEGIGLRVACVAYRDPLESAHFPDDNHDHEVLETTTSSAFCEFMNNLSAEGGGDAAEDVAGALELLNSLIEKEDDLDQALLVIHVTDCGGHGWHHDDNHDTQTERDRLSSAVSELVLYGERFSSFEYHMFEVGRHVLGFTRHLKSLVQSNITTHRSIEDVFKTSKPEEDFSNALINSTFESVSASVKSKFNDPFSVVKDDENPAVSALAWAGVRFTSTPISRNVVNLDTTGATCIGGLFDIALLGVTITLPQVPASNSFFECLKEYCKPAPTLDHFNAYRMNWWSHLSSSGASTSVHISKRPKLETTSLEPVILMRDSPLGKGNEHLVFHGHMVHMEKDQVKKLKTDSRDQFCLNSEPTFEVVLKVNMTSNCDVYPKLEIYAAVKYLSNKFNEMNRVHNLEFVNVEVISPFIVHVGHNTKYMGSEKKIFVTPRKVSEFSILGEYSLTKYSSDYVKWLNNNGMTNAHLMPDISETYLTYYVVLHAFILFCWRVTTGNFVPTDLQGKLVLEEEFNRLGQDTNTSFLLTDLACSCKNKMAFDETVNLGEFFVQKIAAGAYNAFHGSDPVRFKRFVAAMGANESDFDNI